MSKDLYCNKCDSYKTADRYENIDMVMYLCPECDCILFAESYEGEQLSSEEFNIVVYSSLNKKTTKKVPCQCGEGYTEMTARELKKYIKELEEQIDHLVDAAHEMLDYKNELVDLLYENN